MKHLYKYNSFLTESLTVHKYHSYKLDESTFNNICDCFTSLGDKYHIRVSNPSNSYIRVEIASNKFLNFFYITNEIIDTIKFSINYLNDKCELDMIVKSKYNKTKDYYFKSEKITSQYRTNTYKHNYYVGMIDEVLIKEDLDTKVLFLVLTFKYI